MIILLKKKMMKKMMKKIREKITHLTNNLKNNQDVLKDFGELGEVINKHL